MILKKINLSPYQAQTTSTETNVQSSQKSNNCQNIVKKRNRFTYQSNKINSKVQSLRESQSEYFDDSLYFNGSNRGNSTPMSPNSKKKHAKCSSHIINIRKLQEKNATNKADAVENIDLMCSKISSGLKVQFMINTKTKSIEKLQFNTESSYFNIPREVRTSHIRSRRKFRRNDDNQEMNNFMKQQNVERLDQDQIDPQKNEDSEKKNGFDELKQQIIQKISVKRIPVKHNFSFLLVKANKMNIEDISNMGNLQNSPQTNFFKANRQSEYGVVDFKNLIEGKRQIRHKSVTKSNVEINPYTKEEYLYSKKRKEELTRQKLKEGLKANFSIIKPCQIKAFPLSSRNDIKEEYERKKKHQNFEYIDKLTKIRKKSQALQSPNIERSKMVHTSYNSRQRSINRKVQNRDERLQLNPWESQACQNMTDLI